MDAARTGAVKVGGAGFRLRTALSGQRHPRRVAAPGSGTLAPDAAPPP